MPRLVFVHGIAEPAHPPETRLRWLNAFVEGARGAGHTRLAARVAENDGVHVEFVYYRDLFHHPGAPDGDGDGDGDDVDLDVGLGLGEARLLVDLLTEAIDGRLEGAPHHRDAALLAHARAELAPDLPTQDASDLRRRALNAATTLVGLEPLHRAGQWASGASLLRDLAQVARYLGRGEPDADGRGLDDRIRATVLTALGPGPAVVVAHSLGSVVAFEALHGHRGEIPLLVTIGSPLGLRSVTGPHLCPQPPTAPECVEDWLNGWDRDDLFSAPPLLAETIGTNRRGVAPRTVRVASNGLWAHPATRYLRQPAVAGPVAEALGDLLAAVPR